MYILASQYKGTLYIGVSSNLIKRIWQHKNDVVPGFTQKHQVHYLVHFEQFLSMEDAIHREKCLKKWKRNWKIRLIEEHNPEWRDLYQELVA